VISGKIDPEPIADDIARNQQGRELTDQDSRATVRAKQSARVRSLTRDVHPRQNRGAMNPLHLARMPNSENPVSPYLSEKEAERYFQRHEMLLEFSRLF
jgi:hypothetical protein